MERRNTVLLTVIAVATLLVAVVGATFAYFTATQSAIDPSEMTVTTADVDTVTGDATNCSLTVTGEDMAYAAGTSAGTAITDEECTLTVHVAKSSDATEVCTYIITYEPNTTSPSQLFTHSTGYTTDGTKTKELTLSGSVSADTGITDSTTYSETDLSTYTQKTTIVSSGSFTATATGDVVWTFVPTMYNYNFDQSSIADKTYGGTLKIENLQCRQQGAQS